MGCALFLCLVLGYMCVLPSLWSNASSDQNTDFIERVEGYGHQRQGEGVGRGDECRNDHNDDEGVASIAGKQIAADQPCASQEICQNGDLENESHHQRKGGESRDVGAESDGVHDSLVHLISA